MCSMTDYEPGTVAVATVHGVPNVRVFRYSTLAWVSLRPVSSLSFHSTVTDVRPLVVIDPEDREQVERLTGALVYSGAGKNDDNHWREVQAALREFADPKPPKPEEPTGLGAVVEAVCKCQPDRVQFVRGHTGSEFIDAPWKSACGHHVYGDLTAVRVLSEGVTDD